MSTMVPVSAIEAAASRIKGVVRQTPLVELPLDARVPVRAKCENLQATGAFKIRGAYNFIAQLSQEERRCGVITYSSGNHAQAVALAAGLVGVPAVVVMPTTAPSIKVEGAQSLGAEVVFEGTTSADRKTRAEAVARDRGLQMVPPFDHPSIIAGQGTVGLEILRDCPEVARVLVPVGGGGLISGVAAAVKQQRPEVRVIGVEPEGAAKMRASLAAGRPVTLDRVASIADGLVPVRPGDLTFDHARRFVDEIVTVSDDAIAGAVLWLFRRAKLVVETSGAATLAAILDNEGMWSGSGAGPTVAVLSGGNIGLDSLAELAARSEESGGRRQEAGDRR
jgi:threonine dehydratase|tara:strand:+ start:5048 stop:6055 length:1008 start_codon:yes stop_codon:yes gene_type:complete